MTPDLTLLEGDQDRVELVDGRTLRLRIDHDLDYEPFDETDCYGSLAAVSSGRDGYHQRPDGFDGNAEKIWLAGSYRAWWQPPTDGPKRTDADFKKFRDFIIELASYGAYIVTLEVLDGVDAYRKPIVTEVASLGGVDSLDDGYLAEIVRQLADELGIDYERGSP